MRQFTRTCLLLVLLLSLLMSFSACARKRGPSRFAEMMNGYIGEHIDDLISEFGIPNSRYRKEDGGAIFEWREANFHKSYIGGTSTYWTYCETTVTTDEDDYIIGWRAKGNGCN